MKDAKTLVGLLIPIIGLALLLGWLLGRSGWGVTEVDTGIIKLAPPTVMPFPQSPSVTSPVAFATTVASSGWLHNPTLPSPVGYPGHISYTKQDYPGNSNADWVYGINLSVSDKQILLVAGYAAFFPPVGNLGGPSHCFLLIGRGPIQSTIDVLAAGIEIHNITQDANVMLWAAQKVKEMREIYPSCASSIDVWVKP